VISPFVGESAERVWDRQHVQAIDRTVQRAALRKLEVRKISNSSAITEGDR